MYDSLINCLLGIKYRYIPLMSTIANWFALEGVHYSTVSLEWVRLKPKKSDTLFILGASESINDITDDKWLAIEEHSSIRMNWWSVHRFIPTYSCTIYLRGEKHFKRFCKTLHGSLSKKRHTLKDPAIFFRMKLFASSANIQNR